MANESRSDIDVHRENFGRLVQQGVYSPDFEHAPPAQRFVESVLARISGDFSDRKRIAFLDCGCGSGAWLDFALARLGTDHGLTVRGFGFDITPEMAQAARGRLGRSVCETDIAVGDVLDPAAYRFASGQRHFDVIFAYDIIQQLPRRSQFAACQLMVSRLSDNGMLIVFDHDRHSRYGRRMGFRKFVTRYLGMRLVPRYYCNAHYPPLAQFAKRLEANGPFNCEIMIGEEIPKQALIVRRRERNE